jgi:hypothetical protein
MNNLDKVCFIISHKYFRGYPSYLKYYIENIQRCYPEALTVVVDNNSVHVKDIFSDLQDFDRVVLLDNDIESKFELGAYQVGMRYIVENNLVDDYEYYIYTQDNFVLKNKYDFAEMASTETYAKPINSMYADGECRDVVVPIMERLQMNDNWDKVNFCWCSSFVVASKKVLQLYEYLKQIVVTCRWESCAGERYLARILWELNERKDCGDVDGSCSDLAVRHYDTWNVDVLEPSTSYFVKQVQQKNENTVDSDSPQDIVFVHRDELEDEYGQKKN